MQCRPNCGACCIEPSIVQGFYGMPQGKPAGVACVHLAADRRCGLFGDPRRPRCCSDFEAEALSCGDSREQALVILAAMEHSTLPSEPGQGSHY